MTNLNPRESGKYLVTTAQGHRFYSVYDAWKQRWICNRMKYYSSPEVKSIELVERDYDYGT